MHDQRREKIRQNFVAERNKVLPIQGGNHCSVEEVAISRSVLIGTQIVLNLFLFPKFNYTKRFFVQHQTNKQTCVNYVVWGDGKRQGD